MVSAVSALSFTSPYSTDSPLEGYPGESKEIVIPLQSSSDADAKISIVSDSANILSLGEDEYEVLQGVLVQVKVKIKIPSSAVIGESYNFELKAEEVGVEGQEGTVQLGASTSLAGSLKVIEKPVDAVESEGLSTTWIILAIVLIVALIVVIWFVAKGKKETEISGKSDSKK